MEQPVFECQNCDYLFSVQKLNEKEDGSYDTNGCPSCGSMDLDNLGSLKKYLEEQQELEDYIKSLSDTSFDQLAKRCLNYEREIKLLKLKNINLKTTVVEKRES